MKTLMLTTSALLLLCASTMSFAQDGPVVLGPVTHQNDAPPLAAPPAGQPAPAIEPIPAAPVQTVSLFHCVRVKDPHHIHPCAVPMIVQIADPCPRNCCDPCNPCAQCCNPCVNVQICVPPCGCPKVKTRRNGHYVKYDYGKYRIEITSRNGRVIVDYDD